MASGAFSGGWKGSASSAAPPGSRGRLLWLDLEGSAELHPVVLGSWGDEGSFRPPSLLYKIVCTPTVSHACMNPGRDAYPGFGSQKQDPNVFLGCTEMTGCHCYLHFRLGLELTVTAVTVFPLASFQKPPWQFFLRCASLRCPGTVSEMSRSQPENHGRNCQSPAAPSRQLLEGTDPNPASRHTLGDGCLFQ